MWSAIILHAGVYTDSMGTLFCPLSVGASGGALYCCRRQQHQLQADATARAVQAPPAAALTPAAARSFLAAARGDVSGAEAPGGLPALTS